MRRYLLIALTLCGCRASSCPAQAQVLARLAGAGLEAMTAKVGLEALGSRAASATVFGRSAVSESLLAGSTSRQALLGGAMSGLSGLGASTDPYASRRDYSEFQDYLQLHPLARAGVLEAMSREARAANKTAALNSFTSELERAQRALATPDLRPSCKSDLADLGRNGFDLNLVTLEQWGKRIIATSPAGRKIVPADVFASSRVGVDHGFMESFRVPTYGSRVIVKSPTPLVAVGAGEVPTRQIHDFTWTLQKTHPELLVYRTPVTEATRDRVRMLDNLRAGSNDNVLYIVPGLGFDVPKSHFANNVERGLVEAGNGLITYDRGSSWRYGTGKVVILLLGHESEAMAQFVDELGQAGAFRDNAVVLFSCESKTTRALAHRINVNYGAIATLCFEGEICGMKASEVYVRLAERLELGLHQGVWVTHGVARMIVEVARTLGLYGVWTLALNPPRDVHPSPGGAEHA